MMASSTDEDKIDRSTIEFDEWIKAIETLLYSKQHYQALIIAVTMINQDDLNPLGHYYAGICLKLSGEFEGALSAFHEAITRNTAEDIRLQEIHGHIN